MESSARSSVECSEAKLAGRFLRFSSLESVGMCNNEKGILTMLWQVVIYQSGILVVVHS